MKNMSDEITTFPVLEPVNTASDGSTFSPAGTGGGFSSLFQGDIYSSRGRFGNGTAYVDIGATNMHSSNYVSGSAGWQISYDGNVEINNLVLYGGNISYGKTSFADSANAGYWMSSDGVYFGAANDTTKFKYSITDGTFDFVGTIDGTSTIGGRTASTLANAIDASGHFADEAISTASATILGEFSFGESGALQIGTYENGVSGDLKISPSGILARNSSGDTTFSINGKTGVAVLNGLVVGTNVGLGTAQDSAGVTTIVGNTVTTAFVNALNVNAASVSASISITTPTITGGIIKTQADGNNRIELRDFTDQYEYLVFKNSDDQVTALLAYAFANKLLYTYSTDQTNKAVNKFYPNQKVKLGIKVDDGLGDIGGTLVALSSITAGEKISSNVPIIIADGTTIKRHYFWGTGIEDAGHGFMQVINAIIFSNLYTSFELSRVSIFIKDFGTIAGTMTAGIKATSSGNPTGDYLTLSSAVDITTAGGDWTEIVFDFTAITIEKSTSYAIIFDTSSASGAYDVLINQSQQNGIYKYYYEGSWITPNPTYMPKCYLYTATTSGKVYASSSLASSGTIPFIGFTPFAVEKNDSFNVNICIQDGFTGLTNPSKYYLEDNTGKYGTSAGTVSVQCGYAISTTEMIVKPNIT